MTELLALGSIEAAVDNVLAVDPNPPNPPLTGSGRWVRAEELTHTWLNRMAHDSVRPIQEKMAFLWHGHYCSGFEKVVSADHMQEQIDLFRREGLGAAGSAHSIVDLTKRMATQVAMLRYLDNNLNKQTSPNQNFARELMELFVLGVGNYTEADVEAATAAWTGHSTDFGPEYGTYVWRADWHDGSVKTLLGQTINAGASVGDHGVETIDVMFGSGQVPLAAPHNPGRPTREVAAEFLSTKLWREFANSEPPPAVLTAMRTSLLSTGFQIRPWVRLMLLREEFYSDTVKTGLVRTPVEYVVAMLRATGNRSEATTTSFNHMLAMGQLPLYPPHVAGWGINSYWIHAGAMDARASAALRLASRSAATFEQPGGGVHLLRGFIPTTDFTGVDGGGNPVKTGAELVDRMIELMDVQLLPASRAELVSLAESLEGYHRLRALATILLAPEMNVA